MTLSVEQERAAVANQSNPSRKTKKLQDMEADLLLEPVSTRVSLYRGFYLILFAVLFGVLFAGYEGYSWVGDKIDPPGEPGAERVVEVPQGSSMRDVADLLADANVVSDSTIFNLYAQVNASELVVKAGKFELNENMSMSEAIAVLDKGPLPPEFLTVTVPEGFRLDELVTAVAEQGEYDEPAVEAAVALPSSRSEFLPSDVNNLEGFLFPDTYQVGLEDSPADLLERMKTEMDTVLRDLGYDGVSETEEFGGLSTYQLVVIASIIEEEAKVDGDRAKIARVIYNRLEAGMPLQIDATIIYAHHLEGRSIEGAVTLEALEIESPYNSYRNTSLPPSPIAMPSRKSLAAAINPEAGDWIFYVLADADGYHFFTDSAEEFEKQKAKSQEEGLF